MCPGGQIVPSSTEAEELCINGMSFSLRDSKWANSALVVTVGANDPILEDYRETHGPLAGLEFQREIERRAYVFGGRDLSAPVQRLTDFVSGKVSESVPESSYRLGVKSAPLHDIYPKPLYNALVDAITTKFDAQMPGFLREDALLHGVETRTSSPVRIPRDAETLQALGVRDLYPCGEGLSRVYFVVAIATIISLYSFEQVRAMQVASFLRLLMGYSLPTRYVSKHILAATNALCSRKVTRCLVSGLITKQS